MRCALASCKSDNMCKNFNKEIMFFRFPTDPNLQKVWINVCKRKDTINVKYARVCSKHFSEDSYERNLRHELLGYTTKNRRLLKADAVPSMNLTNNPTMKPQSGSRKERLSQRSQLKLENEIFLTEECQSECNDGDGNKYYGDGDSNVVTNTKGNLTIALPENNFSLPVKEIGTMTDSDGKDEIIAKLKEEIEYLKRDKKAFEQILTPNQLKKFKNLKKRVTWTVPNKHIYSGLLSGE